MLMLAFTRDAVSDSVSVSEVVEVEVLVVEVLVVNEVEIEMRGKERRYK